MSPRAWSYNGLGRYVPRCLACHKPIMLGELVCRFGEGLVHAGEVDLVQGRTG